MSSCLVLAQVSGSLTNTHTHAHTDRYTCKGIRAVCIQKASFFFPLPSMRRPRHGGATWRRPVCTQREGRHASCSFTATRRRVLHFGHAVPLRVWRRGAAPLRCGTWDCFMEPSPVCDTKHLLNVNARNEGNIGSLEHESSIHTVVQFLARPGQKTKTPFFFFSDE